MTTISELFWTGFGTRTKNSKGFFKSIDISIDPKSYIGSSNEWDLIVSEAFEGERGKNFIGNLQSLNKAQDFMEL